MKCPRCKATIGFDQRQCSFCGKRIEGNLFQQLILFLRSFRSREDRIAKAVASGEMPSINSRKDFKLFLKHKIGNEEVAIVVPKIINKLGYKCQVEVKKGEKGNPYKIEYEVLELLDKVQRQALEKRVMELRKSIDDTDQPMAREELGKELFRLVDQSYSARAIIWIHSSSEEDFERRKSLIEKAFKAAREIFEIK